MVKLYQAPPWFNVTIKQKQGVKQGQPLNVRGGQGPLLKHSTENLKQIFPEKELCGYSPNFHIHVSVSNLYIPTIDLPVLLQENMWTDPKNI
jgi:hypothetical protein